MTSLAGKVAVVTGATSGIGRATALELAHRGASVVVAARRADVLESVAGECRGAGVEALAVQTDTGDESSVDALARAAVERFGRVDVWVNNAATSIYGRLETTDSRPVRRLFDVNVFGYLFGARAALRQFRVQGSGTLIDVASMLGKVAGPWQGHYAMTKHAIVAMDEALRTELIDAPDIHVCTVMPAAIDTPFYGHAANYSGRRPKPPGPVYPPEAVATTIASLAERPRREVYVGSVGGLTSALRRISPGLYEAIYGRVLQRDQFLDEPAPPTDGILFAPLDESTPPDGGWRERMPHRAVPSRRAAAALAALTALGVGGWLAATRDRAR
jgi:NAD(P)-dependent dehydrogenase (short-subunit alcohol dehydrogenase family)